MKTHLKTLGVILVLVGGLIGLFVLFALLLGVLAALGIVDGGAGQGLASAVVIFSVLAYPAFWIVQTGFALFYQRKSGRMSGIALSAILFIGLNLILLLIKNPPGKTGRGFLTFHVLMILIGVYGLVVLVPARVKESLQ